MSRLTHHTWLTSGPHRFDPAVVKGLLSKGCTNYKVSSVSKCFSKHQELGDEVVAHSTLEVELVWVVVMNGFCGED